MLIKTPSRLHIVLIDLNGSYKRVDGGAGLTLAEPAFILESEPADRGISIEFAPGVTDAVQKAAAEKKVLSGAQNMAAQLGLEEGFHFTVHQTYPAHSGLGSGTQMALAAGKLVSESAGRHFSSYELACIVGRGGTSGIGTYAFDMGGFIIDGGHSLKEKATFRPSSASDAKPPVLLGRYAFPEDWEVLLAVPHQGTCYSGKEELNIFRDYCPLPKAEVEQMSHIVFMNMVPFVIEHDLEGFSYALDMIQTTAFNKLELQLQPPAVTKLMNDMRAAGAYGVGLSSLGPSVFTVFDKDNRDIVQATKDLLGDDGEVIVTKAQNHGAVLW